VRRSDPAAEQAQQQPEEEAGAGDFRRELRLHTGNSGFAVLVHRQATAGSAEFVLHPDQQIAQAQNLLPAAGKLLPQLLVLVKLRLLPEGSGCARLLRHAGAVYPPRT
jgi:hypothetical protein